jgi:rubrerythrin
MPMSDAKENMLVSENVKFNSMEYFRQMMDRFHKKLDETLNITIKSDENYDYVRNKNAYIAILSLDEGDDKLKRTFCNNFVRFPTSETTNLTQFSVNCKVADIIECRLSSQLMKLRQYFIIGIDGKLFEIDVRHSDCVLKLLAMTRDERFTAVFMNSNPIEINDHTYCNACGSSFSSNIEKCPTCGLKPINVEIN